MAMMNRNYRLDEIPDVSREILAMISHKILLFYGDMGAGKTTLIKALCRALKSDDTVSSPTFSLVNEYQTTGGDSIFHFDFYRISNEEEALDIGIEDYLYHDNWCFIEWPQNIKNLLPLDAVTIKISILEDGLRNIKINTL